MTIYTRINECYDNLKSNFFYISECLGVRGPFTRIKIRTMYKTAEENLESLVKTNGLNKHGKINGDKRVIPLVGEILRKMHIDEVPQLKQFKEGDLFLVGIRPKTKEYWNIVHSKKFSEIGPKYAGLIPISYAWPDLRSPEEKEEKELKFCKTIEGLSKKGKTSTILYLRKKYIKRIFLNMILGKAKSS